MRREELYLADLIDNARAVRAYLDGVTRERWDAEDILRDAVLYRMLLGEIASALPGELRDNHPEVAWRQIRAFRNLAVHKYFGVDWAVVWKIAQEEPALLETGAGDRPRGVSRTGPELRAGTSTGSGYRVLTRSRPARSLLRRDGHKGSGSSQKSTKQNWNHPCALLGAS
jgi:uncharacterized protein with HEPN domain